MFSTKVSQSSFLSHQKGAAKTVSLASIIKNFAALGQAVNPYSENPLTGTVLVNGIVISKNYAGCKRAPYAPLGPFPSQSPPRRLKTP